MKPLEKAGAVAFSRLTYHLRGAAASTFISMVFALAWGVNGSLALPNPWRVIAAVVVVLTTLAMLATAVTFRRNAGRFPADSSTPPTDPFRTTAYRIAVVAMIIAIPVAGRLLTLSGHGDAVMPAVAIIVGLHFLGLVAAFQSKMFIWTAVGFCVLGLVALFLPVEVGGIPTFKPRYAFVGLGCALILWFGILPFTVQAFKQLADAPGKKSH